MKEQFCTYEISLALKELGFDEDCLGYFNTKQEFKNILNPESCNNTMLKGANLIAAPLWQQATQWFLDRKILIEVFPIDDWNYWGYKITGQDSMAPFFVMYQSDEVEYLSRREAEEQSILKAIELCKKENS